VSQNQVLLLCFLSPTLHAPKYLQKTLDKICSANLSSPRFPARVKSPFPVSSPKYEALDYWNEPTREPK
jgi:hypothetical protein